MTGLILAAAPALTATHPRTPPDVSVYITASQPIDGLYMATSQAGAMFHSIGVEVTWIANKPKHPAEGICIEVRLAVDTPARLLPDALALSLPYADPPKPITVFYDRVLRRAQESATPERMLLAHVLVHEITHALEGIDRHSDAGVMKAKWTAADYAAMARRPLPFDEEDIYWIRQRLKKAAATSPRKAGANSPTPPEEPPSPVAW